MSSSEEEDEVAVEYLATSREPRATAGNRMSKLLESEQDQFYKETYGGFEEEENDVDFEEKPGDDVDVFDSDFSNSEDDEVKSDSGDEIKRRKRTKGVVTKAYKDPKTKRTSHRSSTRPKCKKEHSVKDVRSSFLSPRKVRSRTEQLRQQQREKESLAQKNVFTKVRRGRNVRNFTQAELLAESVLTEKINSEYLETFFKQEEAKKKARQTKKVTIGPQTILKSFCVSEVPKKSFQSIFETLSDDCEKEAEKMRVTHLTFTTQEAFSTAFPAQKSPQITKKSICPVTLKPAKYFDPLTKTPYATKEAFKVIRHLYKIRVNSDSFV